MTVRIPRAAWEFVVGDDWRVALGVVVILAAIAVLAGLGLAAWWLGPLGAVAILYASVRRVARRRLTIR
jgi:hypothetical protein